MRSFRVGLAYIAIAMTPWMFLGCASDSFFDQAVRTSFSGYVAVSTVATAQTTAAVPVGPGLVSLFDTKGTFVAVLKDFYASSEYVNGLALLSNSVLFLGVDGVDRIEQVLLSTRVDSTFASNANITSTPLRGMTMDSSGNVYIIESTNFVEKVDSTGTRVGNPFINTTTGTAPVCTLNSPFGVTYIPTTDRIAVSQFRTSGGTMVIYSSSGTCVASVSAAPWDSNFPTAIVYHAATNKLLVARLNDSRIYATDTDGTNAVQAYLNTGRVSAPTSMTVDANGYVYVGSSGTDTIEKMSFDGTTLTPVASSPFINTSIYVQNPTAIVVVP